ncbi:hypothetical protein HDV05_001719, partial [Chytridiales sp. JEL 0842]
MNRWNDPIFEASMVTVPDTTKWATSLKGINNTPFIAVGTAASSNNLFILENTSPVARSAQSNLDTPVASTPSTSSLKIRSAFSAPEAIHCMSVQGDKLITGGPGASVQMFKLDLEKLGEKGKGVEHVEECVLENKKLEDVKLAPPGKRCASIRVRHVEFEPTKSNPTKFLALEGKKLYIWDMNANKVAVQETVSFDQLITATWNPHPSCTSLIATAGVDHSLSILDSRLMGADITKSLVWRVKKAHGGHCNAAINA